MGNLPSPPPVQSTPRLRRKSAIPQSPWSNRRFPTAEYSHTSAFPNGEYRRIHSPGYSSSPLEDGKGPMEDGRGPMEEYNGSSENQENIRNNIFT